MEKIYMENNNKKKKSKLSGSVIISFSVALVAIISLVAFGFNQISYAIPDVESPLPDSFSTKSFNSSTDMLIGDVWTHQIDMHYAVVDGKNVPVFCLQQSVAFCDGSSNTTYSKGEIVTDAGLLYLMANLYPNVTMTTSHTINNSSMNTNHQIETWITQAAIWVYLTETATDSQYNALSSTDLANIRATKSIQYTKTLGDSTVGLSDATLFEGYKVNGMTINQLITKAKSLHANSSTTLNAVKASDTISLTSDENYYQSDEISVVGSVADESLGSFNGFALSINNAPDGTIIVDKDGNEIKDLTNLTPGTKFYVRVPVNKLTDKNKKIEISVEGSFKSYTGNRYVADGCQTITTVKTVNNNKSIPLEIEFNYSPSVPDTGMSTAQSIYFIGLIVLLSGVGIIYATVKPAKSN